MRDLTRVLLFTGKGGVGKTSVAAATAARAAGRGQRVLVTSTDPAHSLADAFDTPLADAPLPIATPGDRGSLHGQQIDAQARLERHWHEIRDYLVGLLAWGGVGQLEAEELVLLPGLDELFSLIDLRRHVDDGEYDLVVVDCAPTAETMKLLSLPDSLRWYAGRFLGPGRRVARAVRPLGRTFGGDGPLPVPEDGVFDAVDRVHADLAAVHELLQDPGRSSIRLVVNPERLVVSEAERSATTLSLFGYSVDAVVVNRVLPDEVTDPYLANWKRQQAAHLATIREVFSPVPVLTAPLLGDEPIGVDGLELLASAVYGEIDESAVLHTQRPVTLEANGDDHILRISLPRTGRDDVELHRRSGDLHIKVAGVRRTIPLPAVVQRAEVVGAGLVDGWLEVRLAAPAPAGAS